MESIAKEVIFLKKGNIIAQGSVDTLIQEHPHAESLEDVYLNLFKEEETL